MDILVFHILKSALVFLIYRKRRKQSSSLFKYRCILILILKQNNTYYNVKTNKLDT